MTHAEQQAAAVSRCILVREAARRLPKSPVWLVLDAFLQAKMTTVVKDLLTDFSLTPDQVAERRQKLKFLREDILRDLANTFRAAYTGPPPSDDPTLASTAVPEELEALLSRFGLSDSPTLQVSQPPPLRVSQPPRPIDPFTGKSTPPPP